MLIVRPEIPEQIRREALAELADSPEKRANLLMQLAKSTLFDPDNTAEAITPLLLELSPEAVFSINGDLDKLIAGSNASLKSTAVALKVRGGAPLGELAKKYPTAVIQAIATLPTEQAPAGLSEQLLVLAEDGTLDSGLAFGQAARLTSDTGGLFTYLAAHVENVKDLDYDNWGPGHKLAMASLSVMHSIPLEDWPAGYSEFKLASADHETLELGKELYYEEEKGCVKCHGEHGEGTEGFPPLAGSPNLLGDPLRAATIVKHGLKGELAHTLNPSDSKPYNAQMEPLSYFNDAEIAAVVTYARQHFGNFASTVTPKQVAATRPSEDGLMWDISALQAKYPFKRDRITGPLPPPSIDLQKWSPPSSGLPVMLIVVGLSMLLILGGTYAGKFLQSPGSVADIANDHMQTPVH